MTLTKKIRVPAELSALKERLDWEHFVKKISFPLDCSTLPDTFPKEALYIYPELHSCYKHLIATDNFPVVYWFTVVSDHTCEDVWETMRTAKKDAHCQFSHIPKKCVQSRVLYVGRSWRNISGRWIAHCGWPDNPTIYALRLALWAKELGLKLRFNGIVLRNIEPHEVDSWEKIIADHLKPFVGWHAPIRHMSNELRNSFTHSYA